MKPSRATSADGLSNRSNHTMPQRNNPAPEVQGRVSATKVQSSNNFDNPPIVVQATPC